MPNNQNPVFTDNTTITGDGTEENPLVAVGGGGDGVTSLNSETGDIDLISSDASVGIDASTPGQIDLTVAGGGGGVTDVTGTANQITSSGGATPQIGLASNCIAPGALAATQDFTAHRNAVIAAGFFLKFANCFLQDNGAGFLSPFDTGGSLAGMILAFLRITTLQVFANNAAALGGGLVAGDLYRTGADPDVVCVVH